MEPVEISPKDLPPSVARGAIASGGRLTVVSLDGAARRILAQLQGTLDSDGRLSALARWGGSAIALAAHAAARSAGGERVPPPVPAFAVSVGGAVRRGLPTAARGSLTARAPLREGLVEAPFGGGWARALAATTDALLIYGQSNQRLWLHVHAGGEVEFRRVPFGETAAASERSGRLLEAGRHGLIVGPAAEAGSPLANVGSWTGPEEAGGTPLAPSLVGRGGLGLTLAQIGVVAITVTDTDELRAQPAEEPGDGSVQARLRHELSASPRLLARAHGGTLELAELRGGDVNAALERGASGRTKHGCQGCPTPCGWQFQVDASEPGRVGGRYSALQGFLGGDDPVRALERCNELGLDARGAALVLERCDDPLGHLEQLVIRGSSEWNAALRLQAARAGEPAAVAHEEDLAARAGGVLAARGPEPLRSLSVLGLGVGQTIDAEGRARLARDLRLGGLRADREYNAGVIARWQECFSAAVDVTGFCAFSAAGLIADGRMTVDELVSSIVPWRCEPGEWLRMGADVSNLHAELYPRTIHRSVLPTATLRGYEDARQDAGGVIEAGLGSDRAAPPATPVVTGGAAPTHLACLNVPERLAARLGSADRALEVGLHPGWTVSDLCVHLAETHPAARDWLLTPSGRPLPAVLLDGVPAEPLARLGRVLQIELLLAIPGG